MDLSFTRFEHDATVTLLAPDLAVLLVGVAARQAASPTALVQVRVERVEAAAAIRFAPAHGAFDVAVADLLAARPSIVKPAFTAPVSGTPSDGELVPPPTEDVRADARKVAQTS